MYFVFAVFMFFACLCFAPCFLSWLCFSTSHLHVVCLVCALVCFVFPFPPFYKIVIVSLCFYALVFLWLSLVVFGCLAVVVASHCSSLLLFSFLSLMVPR